MQRTVITRALFVVIMLALALGLAVLGSHRTAAQVPGLDAGSLGTPGLTATDAGLLGTPTLSLDAGSYGTGTSALPGMSDAGVGSLPSVAGDAGTSRLVLDAGM